MPDWTQTIKERLANLNLAPTREAEIVEEMAQHFADRYDELVCEGISEREAEEIVMSDLNDSPVFAELQQVERHASDHIALGASGGTHVIQDVWQDLRYGLRVLLNAPAFTLTAIVVLALGIGANTAIFSITDKLLIKALNVSRPQELVLVTSVSVSPHFVSNAFSYPIFADYRNQNRSLAGLLAFSRSRMELKTADRNFRVAGEYVSNNYFEVLGVSFKHGRAFLANEENDAVAIVSDSFARKRFGDPAQAVGQTITINNQPLTIIGIAPPTFNGLMLEDPTEVWVPVLMHEPMEESDSVKNRKDRWLQLLGRIQPGTNQSQAEASFDLVAQQVKEANTRAGTITKGLPFSEQHIKFEPGARGISLLRKQFSGALMLLMATAGLVLFIACANLGGLLLARSVARQKEMAIRLSLGANGWRIARQLFMESVLLGLTGATAGLLLAPWLVNLLVKSQATGTDTLSVEILDLRVLLFCGGVTLLAVVIFGIFPAWRGSRLNLVHTLKDEGISAHRGSRLLGFRNLLVVTQVALALVVLVGAGLCVKTLRNLLAIDPGYNTENLLLVPVEIDEKKYDKVRGAELQKELTQRLAALPGVEVVSQGLVIPLSGSRYMSSIFVAGHQPLPSEQMAFDANAVGPLYHRTMGIAMLQGRDFTEQDRAGAPGVVIINESLARKLFNGESGIGKKLTLRTDGQPLEIIGVARDIKYHDLTEAPLPHFDLPALQRDYNSYINIVLRTSANSAELVPQFAVRSCRSIRRCR